MKIIVAEIMVAETQEQADRLDDLPTYTCYRMMLELKSKLKSTLQMTNSIDSQLKYTNEQHNSKKAATIRMPLADVSQSKHLLCNLQTSA